MTVLEIIEKYLVENGYAGLCKEDCGCFIGDLAPCEHLNPGCRTGVAREDSKGIRIITTEENQKCAE